MAVMASQVYTHVRIHQIVQFNVQKKIPPKFATYSHDHQDDEGSYSYRLTKMT